jgi:hypothetical protein
MGNRLVKRKAEPKKKPNPKKQKVQKVPKPRKPAAAKQHDDEMRRQQKGGKANTKGRGW